MRSRFFVLCSLLTAVTLVALGCSEPVPPPEVSEEIRAQRQEEVAEKAEAIATQELEGDEHEMKRAGVGATGKGQYGVTSDHPMSIVTTPVSAYFYAQEKTVFDVQIPHALSLFQASEGRYPNSEQEFMQRIIQANQIILPKLPEGDSYVYDVSSHTLMVRTLKAQQ